MQRISCDDVKLIISKYVDGEATHQERDVVDSHVAGCTECACKLTEYMELAAIFAEAPVHAPQPELRAGVFRGIGEIKEEARRKESLAAGRPWYKLPTVVRGSGKGAALGREHRRWWSAASPLAALSLALCALFAYIYMNGAPTRTVRPENEQPATISYPPVSTIPATVVYSSLRTGGSAIGQGGVPPALGTVNVKQASPPPAASASVVVPGASTVGGSGSIMLRLQQLAPVLETGTAWHRLHDSQFDYSISYPSNWWTQVRGNSRFFYPWGQGGTMHAPYWVDMRVAANPQHLDAAGANQAMFRGEGKLEGDSDHALWLRHASGTDAAISDELYAFDQDFIYTLRLTVPKSSPTGDFSIRWNEAQAVLSKMSLKLALKDPAGSALFLNGGDLWAVDSGGQTDAQVVWRGYGTQWVKQFVLSPDGVHAAVAATDKSDDPWAKDVYLSKLGSSPSEAQLLMSGGEVHDIAWYGDRELLAIAALGTQGLGIYRIELPSGGGTVSSPQLLVALGGNMAGARGLSVSPDRQLVTFLAPLGESMGTDIYAVRPDGSDLLKVVSHTESVAYSMNDRLITPETQAIKSYAWVDGKLEPEAGGYLFNLLYVGGNGDSPTFYRGGYLYSAPAAGKQPALDPALLGVSDADQVQIVHTAYSPSGKVAFSGFYIYKGFKVETLAGLWTADLSGGKLVNVKALPVPKGSSGLSDLQWSPNGNSLIYREFVPSDDASLASRYDGHTPFSIVELDPTSGEKTVLFGNVSR